MQRKNQPESVNAGRVPDRGSSLLVWRASLAASAVWLTAGALLALTEISDPDLGLHIAYGRLLLKDFGVVGRITFGQDASIHQLAYSYWAYQVLAALVWDHAGAAALVLLRAILILGAFAGAVAVARRMRAGAGAIAFTLAIGIVLSQERFLDRPELVSFAAWVAALYILVHLRGERRIWLLVPLQILWVNTHLWFGLLPALAFAFAAGDAVERHGHLRRDALVIGALLVATFVNPAGPGAWRSQLHLVQFLGKTASLPFSIQEMKSPFSGYQPTPAVWIFRFAMPAALIVAVAARRRLGWSAIFALAIAATLSAKARRAMPLFGLTSVAILPAAITDLAVRVPARIRSRIAITSAGVLLLSGIALIYGLADGRIFLAQDRDTRIALRVAPNFPALGAARFIATERCEGPIFSNALAAGALLWENGARIPPFLDARWVGTPETISAYQRLRTASDETVNQVWTELDRARHFELVVLDFYEMPALLRYLSIDNPDWATVYVDPTFAVLLRRDKLNEEKIHRLEPGVLLASEPRDPKRDEALSNAVIHFLGSRKPSFLAPLHFPYEPFYRANYALQLRRPYDAQAAYLDLLEHENGSLHASRHQLDILNNLLWCLSISGKAAGVNALAEALEAEPTTTSDQRRFLEETRARALEALGQTAKAEDLAHCILADKEASADERWGAWCRIASIRSAAGDYPAAAEALEHAVAEKPSSAETYRSLGAIYDFRLSRPADALQAYRTCLSLAGKEPDVEARIRILQGGGAR